MITKIILSFLILFPMLITIASSQVFQMEWDAINKELDSGKIQSAKPLLEALYSKAQSQKQRPSMLKSIMHLAAISGRTNEPDDKSIILTMLRYRDSVNTIPEQAIIDYFIAEALKNYYHYSLEEIRTRPQLETNSNDINQMEHWNEKHFLQAIHQRLQSALQDSVLLVSIPGRTYAELLRVKENSEAYRPTLFDLLIYSSLSLLEKIDQDIERVYRPMIADARICSSAMTFMNLSVNDIQGFDLEYGMIRQRISLYQSVLRNHAKDKDQSAFIDANIQRLIGLFPVLSIDAKDSLFINSLIEIGTDKKFIPAQANALLEAVLHHINTDQPGKAYDVCNLIIQLFPNSPFAEQANIHQGKIRIKSLNLTVQQYILPGKPFIFRSEYSHIDKIFCRIYKLSEEVEKRIKKRRYRDSYLDKAGIKQLIDMQPIQAWKQEFPKNDDYRPHSIWKKGPALSKGRYIMLMSNSPIFDLSGDNVIVHAEFTATSIMSLLQKEAGGHSYLHVVDAEQGTPLSAIVQIMESTYDQENNTYKDIISDSFTTNSMGTVDISPIQQEQYIRERYFRIISALDTLIIRHPVNRFPTGEFQASERVQLFTDRQLYRPGQVIQFKAIAFSHTSLDSASVLQNKEIMVRFVDARSKVIDSLLLRTSAFGSCSSSFSIPDEIVTGFCSIQTDLGSVSFRVEEYKRPSFEIVFSKSDIPYSIGDRISVKAMAKTFAGSGLSHARYTYTISRKTSFPCWYKQWIPRPVTRDREIAHGSGILDKNGHVSIQFDALKDPMLNPLDAPQYSYSVNLDIIAGNGELQHAETIVDIGTLKANYAFSHKDIYTTKEAFDIYLSCNLNSGIPAKGMRGTIIIESLERLTQLRLPMPFEYGDIEGLSDKDKTLLFPFDQCDNTGSTLTKKAQAVIYSASLTSDEKGHIKPKIPALKTGSYRIRFVSENETIPFTLESTWSVIDEQSMKMSLDEHLLVHATKSTLEPGDTATIRLGSAWEQASILLQIESRGKIIKQERISLSASMQAITIPINRSYRGGIAIHASLVKQNRLISKSMSIMVPWTDKYINITTKTLRDKTIPGSREKFSFSINGNGKDQEALGTIYDASLDALAPKQMYGIYSLWDPSYAQVQPTSLTMSTIYASALFGNRWNESGNGFSVIREFDEFNLDLLLGGIFGRTEVLYYSDMVMAKSMMESPMQSQSRMSQKTSTLSKDAEVQSQERITPRIAMQETALFAPSLNIRNGEVHMETVMPDALTRWNIRLFAHAKDMSFGTLDTSIISQKDFMMTSNVPRFVRHGDQMQLRSTLFVLGSTTTIKGKATLAYFVDDDSLNVNMITSDFTASISSPGQVQWNITIPKGRNITCTFSGESGSYQDAERYSIPILPSTLPITDRYPIWLNPEVNTTQSLALEEASDIQSLSIQLSSEPYWYALEALPDLMQTSYGSSLDHMNRYLSSIFAKKFVLGNATLSTVLRDSIIKGRISGNLNPEKGITQNDIGPWESDMLSQNQQASNISIYADPEKIQRIGEHAFDELQKMQSTSGAFPWFPSMSESPYITRQMLIGFGIAEYLSSISTQNRDAFFLINRMIEWLDETYTKELEQMFKNLSGRDTFSLTFSDIHHCYARSYFLTNHPLPNDENISKIKIALWNERMKHGLQSEAMIALFFNRIGETDKAKAMLRSLKERAIKDDQGIHWAVRSRGFNDADIETHGLIIQAFDEIEQQIDIRSGVLTYLLKQKQTRNWSTPSATLSATMSLLNNATSCTNNSITLNIDGNPVTPELTVFPGMMSTNINDASRIKRIDITSNTSCPSWGGVYRHRMMPLNEQFSTAEQAFSVSRHYLRTIPGKGLTPLKEGDTLSLGERITIRIKLSAPQAMNYVHVQDLFPSCFDIMANNSEYRHYQNVWAYIVPKDKAMNFFMDYLPKGISIVDYEVKVDKTGTFSKGMIKAYSIYAPEFGITNGGGMIISSP